MELWAPQVDRAYVETLRAFVAKNVLPVAGEIDRQDVYPKDVVRALAAAGYNAATFPPSLGGGGKSFPHLVAVFEEVAWASAATATSLITIFQSGEILSLYGSDSLKKRFVPRIASGLLCSYAMTEAAHGSDVKHLDTKARRDGDVWVLDGEKSFVTSASAAELFVILAETPLGVSAFAVPRDTPGATTNVPASAATFGLRNGPHVNLKLASVRLPADHLIGEDGQGVKLAATTLDHSRVLAAAIGCGIARAAVDGAIGFAKDRMAFGKHVIEFQGIQWYLAELVTAIDAARLLTYEAARHLDAAASGIAVGAPDAQRRESILDIERYAGEAKLMATKVAVDASLVAIQVCGAWGCVESAPFSRYLRDAKTYEIAGGSSEILKNTIGKYLEKLVGISAAPAAKS